VLTFEHTPLDV
jgi:hypothetical protein